VPGRSPGPDATRPPSAGSRPAPGPAGTLTLHRVTRRFGEHVAVDDVSLEVRAGELLALVGASGSGKTTTLRMAAGYETPDAGHITLTGPDGTPRDMTRIPPERRGFGMVFQHYALFPHMSVEENVAFGLEARGVARGARLARARDALRTVGLDGAGPRSVQSLSGGEQQRVALARAVVIEPRVLLLDEPLSNLDPTLRLATRGELRAMLRRLHLTALFVTHDQEDAFAIADRVALLRRGRLLQVGTPEDLYDRPASRPVAEFIGRAALVAAEDRGTHATVTLGGVARDVRVTRPDGTGAKIARALAVLRPEALTLAPHDGGAGVDPPGAWSGTVTARRFAGAATVYHVDVGGSGGVPLEVATAERGAREGDRVWLRVVREPVALVDADERGAADAPGYGNDTSSRG
jgi:ABC-type Fe3+/spermidine/putrescine transport system ATPase subunit